MIRLSYENLDSLSSSPAFRSIRNRTVNRKLVAKMIVTINTMLTLRREGWSVVLSISSWRRYGSNVGGISKPFVFDILLKNAD